MRKTDEPVEQAEDVDEMVRVSERGVTLKSEPERGSVTLRLRLLEFSALICCF